MSDLADKSNVVPASQMPHVLELNVPPVKPRRRWFRFSLRTVLVVVTLAGVWLGIRFQREMISPGNLSRLGVVSKQLDDDIWRIEWNRDGSRVALVRFNKEVNICESRTLVRVATVGQGKKGIDFAFSPQDGVVALGENNKDAEIVNLSTGESRTLHTPNDQPSVTFSPDGRLLATGGYGDHAHVWDVATGRLVYELDVQVTGGLSVVFSPDGALLAVGNRNSMTNVFDVATGRKLYRLHKDSSQELAFNPRGDILAVGYVDGTVGLWDARTGDSIKTVKTDAKEVYVLDWSPDGTMLVTAGLEGHITIWDAATMTVLRQLPTREAVFGIKFRPDQRSIISSEGAQSTGKSRYMHEWGVSLVSRFQQPQQ